MGNRLYVENGIADRVSQAREMNVTTISAQRNYHLMRDPAVPNDVAGTDINCDISDGDETET
jgi:hypothetical protein